MSDESAIDELIRVAGDPAISHEAIHEAIGPVFASLRPDDRPGAEGMLRRLAEEIIDAPTRPDVAGMIALFCGALVERGLGPSIAIGPILDRLESQVAPDAIAFVAACREVGEESPPSGDDTPDETGPVERHGERISELMPVESASFRALEPFSMAAVAMLARSPESRKASWSRAGLRASLDELGGQYGHAGWLWTMMQVLDDEPILVLHPGEHRGFRARISGLADNFQLHTLLADALVDRGLQARRPTPAEVAAARDAEVGEDGPIAAGSFNLWTWRGLGPDGTLPEPRSLSAHWIWNEGVPADIPPFEGTRVVLLGPPPYERSWTAGRKFPPMTGDLRVEGELTTDELEDLLGRIASAAEPR